MREHVVGDELDELGGLCTFSRPRQLYYSADALALGGNSEAVRAERMSIEALDAYEVAPAIDRAFSDEAGARCALAIARLKQGDAEGAAEAMGQVLALSPRHRIHGVVISVQNVQSALHITESDPRIVAELEEQMLEFSTHRLAIPR